MFAKQCLLPVESKPLKTQNGVPLQCLRSCTLETVTAHSTVLMRSIKYLDTTKI